MALVDKLKLEQFISANVNVLLIGRHGVGKTAIIKAAFSAANYKWKYFSASTLDPWVDLVGVPSKTTNEDGDEVLEIVPPAWMFENYDAIFFDELNRAPEKVLNAVMELIQFKSINGKKLPNLKVVWAAVNPSDEDETYAVTKFDPAHEDRFQVKIEVPYLVDQDYFRDKHGEIAGSFVDWWVKLPEDIKLQVSPRRLDYAADAFRLGHSLVNYLPEASNPKLLERELRSAPFMTRVKEADAKGHMDSFLHAPNNAIELIRMATDFLNQDAFAILQKYKHLLPAELLAGVPETMPAPKLVKAAKAKTKSIWKYITSSTVTKVKDANPLSYVQSLNAAVDIEKLMIEAQVQDIPELIADLTEDLRGYRKGASENLFIEVSKKLMNCLARHGMENGVFVFDQIGPFGKLSPAGLIFMAMKTSHVDQLSADRIAYIFSKLDHDRQSALT